MQNSITRKKKHFKAEYDALKNAIHRCTQRHNAQYKDYGARGIIVDPSFIGKDGFWAFLDAIGPKPDPSLTLDRVDNARGYVPGNLAWTDRTTQQRNRRTFRNQATDLGWGLKPYTFVRRDGVLQTRFSPIVPLDGRELTLREWSEELGIHQRTLKQRIQRGQTPEQALVPTLFYPNGGPRNGPTIH